MFGLRERFRFFRPNRGLQAAMGMATAMASDRSRAMAQGTDSLDLLVAASRQRPVGRLLRRLAVDPAVVAQRATAARVPVAEPGLTRDAKDVVEVVMRRALDQRRDPTPVDLLVALAATPGPARDVLAGLGVDEARLAAIV